MCASSSAHPPFLCLKTYRVVLVLFWGIRTSNNDSSVVGMIPGILPGHWQTFGLTFYGDLTIVLLNEILECNPNEQAFDEQRLAEDPEDPSIEDADEFVQEVIGKRESSPQTHPYINTTQNITTWQVPTQFMIYHQITSAMSFSFFHIYLRVFPFFEFGELGIEKKI